MIWVAYHDESERTQALVSMTRVCRGLDARLAFLGSEAACDAALTAVQETESSMLPHLIFRPVVFPAKEPRSQQAWADTIEVIRAALLETSALGGQVVAWIESPLSSKGVARAKGLRSYDEMVVSLVQSGAVMAVVSAFRLADVSIRALHSILAGPSSLISAQMTGPRCPPWLFSSSGWDLTASAGIPAPHHITDPIFTPMFQAEKLMALGQLGAGVAHELGNPLAIISSSLQYLHRRLASTHDPASDFTMTALHNVERMRGLLNSMLDFAAVRKPRYELVDLKEVISEVLRFTAPECTQRGVTVEVSFDPFLPKAWVDPGGIKQVVLNLIKNALDALEEGGGSTLRLRTRVGADETAVIEIENDGPAIPADVVFRLFGPFFTTKEGGTGLGLYLSRQIAEDHGGRLVIDNLPKGARLILTLPLAHREE